MTKQGCLISFSNTLIIFRDICSVVYKTRIYISWVALKFLLINDLEAKTSLLEWKPTCERSLLLV